MIEIEDPGPRASVQDLGRPGYAQLGVGRSGAADRGALRLANRLVGNREGAAALELTLGGLRARFGEPALVAVTGAPCRVEISNDRISNNRPSAPARDGDRPGNGESSESSENSGIEEEAGAGRIGDGEADAGAGAGADRPARLGDGGMDAPFFVQAGQALSIGSPSHGLRTYLAVRGGIDVPAVLGSRSTDTLSGIGPALVARGTVLGIGRETVAFPNADLAVERRPPAGTPFPIRLGPREEWFTPQAISALTSMAYTVRPETDRVGARLDGPALERRRAGELQSEGMVLGALQVPPDGLPILFLADHPVTGGYPVVAVLRADCLDRAAQLRPGDTVRFRLG
jgi:allophanate hydrolase subunit 2